MPHFLEFLLKTPNSISRTLEFIGICHYLITVILKGQQRTLLTDECTNSRYMYTFTRKSFLSSSSICVFQI